MWKAFQIRKQNDLLLAEEYEHLIDAILLDAWSENALGGTGERIPIQLLSEANFQKPWWVAGGISSDSIKEILRTVRPFGIDASSKLEIEPGIKDLKKVKKLLKEVHTKSKVEK